MNEHNEKGSEPIDETLEAPIGGVPSTPGGSQSQTESQVPVPQSVPVGVPKQIGQYRIRRAIASGGMGTVYEAIQEKPRRTVAVKLMRAGIASRSALRRFEYESQLLARLRHNGIAQVYDAGTHRDGEVSVPYFAMEYIVGAKPITDYVVQETLGTRERLKLFSEICNAVHHGHQKGIIHRDLKPSNILVDSSGQVKIIDFGVARSTDSDMAVTTLQTDVGQLIGTLQYMSPEQCAADPHDIDTRSDVYALGVILFEMLCGRLPYDVKGAAIHEATRVIQEQEPTKLSSFNKTLRGDIETITLKALEKNRNRRYQSASAVMADIQRYLENEPISARPASAVYQFKKLVSRHKTVTAAALSVLLALSSGIIVSDIQRRRALRAEELAGERLQHAETQREKAEVIAEFMRGILAGVEPWVAKGRDTTLLKDMMDGAADRIEKGELSSAPDAELTLRATIGDVYTELALYDAAEKMLKPAVALARSTRSGDHPFTALSLALLGRLHRERVDLEGAEALFRESLMMRKRLFRGDHPDVAKALSNLGDVLQYRGNLEEAEPFFREELEMRRRLGLDDTVEMAMCLNNLGWVIQSGGNLEEAEPLYRESMTTWRRQGSGDNRSLADVLNSLAVLLHARGDFEEAEPIYRESLEMYRRLSSVEYPRVAMALHDLASLLEAAGELESAERLYQNALEMRQRLHGHQHPDTLASVISLAGLRVAQQNPTEALQLLTPIEEKARMAFLGGHAWQFGRLLVFMGKSQAELAEHRSDYMEAESRLLEAHTKLTNAPGLFPSDTVKCIEAIADLYTKWSTLEPNQKYAAKATVWRSKLKNSDSPVP